MRILLLLYLLFPLSGIAQQGFPATWTGNWKGELLWYKGASLTPEKINMELRVQPTDSAHRFSWKLIYGSGLQDSRPYTLIAKDTAAGHWIIDENNGILIDQYLVADKLSGAFTVQNSTIINNYWMQDGNLHVEFYNISAKPVTTSGKGNNESPFVHSYQVKTYQKAILQRMK